MEKYLEILENHGFKHIQHYEQTVLGLEELVIQFYGSEFDLIRVYELFILYKIKVSEVRRVYDKQDVWENNDSITGKIIGTNWFTPVNEIVIY